MVDWRKTIQGLGSAWYLKAEEPTTVMSSQGPALSPVSGNKGKKKAVLGRKKNGRKGTRSTEEDRCNAELELSIEGEKENEVHQSTFEDDEGEQFDLAMEGQSSEQCVLNAGGNVVEGSVTPKSVESILSSGPSTPTKPRNAHVFAPSLILDPPNARTGLKRPAADSPSAFGDLFLTRKLARANPTDNELLLQVLEKVEVLTKTSMEQSELIKRLEKKIDELTKKPTEAVTSDSGVTMASQVAKFAAANKASGFQASSATPEPLAAKSTTGPQLIIDFTRCTTPIVSDLLSDLRKHLQILLSDCQGTKDIKIKGMNRDAKNNQRVIT